MMTQMSGPVFVIVSAHAGTAELPVDFSKADVANSAGLQIRTTQDSVAPSRTRHARRCAELRKRNEISHESRRCSAIEDEAGSQLIVTAERTHNKQHHEVILGIFKSAAAVWVVARVRRDQKFLMRYRRFIKLIFTQVYSIDKRGVVAIQLLFLSLS